METAYRSKKNEMFLARGMFKGNLHQRRLQRRLMHDHIALANLAHNV